MAYIQGEGRGQGSLFPVVLDDLIPVDHMCRVIDAFVTSWIILPVLIAILELFITLSTWIGRLVGYFCPVLTADGKLDWAPK